MSNYFDKFPVITYDGQPVKNIMARVRFSENTKNDPSSFIPHKLENSVTRADLISNGYYGNSYYDWIYYYSNEIVDPYHDTVKDDDALISYIKSKYETLERARDITVFYRNNWASDSTELTISQYEALSANLQKYWSPEVNYYNVITSYKRIKEDWIVSTNQIKTLTVDIITDFVYVGDVYLQFYNNEYVAKAELIGIDRVNNTLTFNNIQGEFTTAVGNYVFGKYGSVGTSIVSEIINPAITDNISAEEAAYWAPVSAYDYEIETNQEKRNIFLLRSSLKGNADAQLTKLLRT
jgi:hypothetical protein